MKEDEERWANRYGDEDPGEAPAQESLGGSEGTIDGKEGSHNAPAS